MKFTASINLLFVSSFGFRLLDLTFKRYNLVPHKSKIDGKDCTTSEYSTNFNAPLFSLFVGEERIRFHLFFKKFEIARKNALK